MTDNGGEVLGRGHRDKRSTRFDEALAAEKQTAPAEKQAKKKRRKTARKDDEDVADRDDGNYEEGEDEGSTDEDEDDVVIVENEEVRIVRCSLPAFPSTQSPSVHSCMIQQLAELAQSKTAPLHAKRKRKEPPARTEQSATTAPAAKDKLDPASRKVSIFLWNTCANSER